ncbi:hypothetical protein BS50DRAFT_590005 [Corynespora cassiicola Philippines]|uniref:Uncharacterized protein n=1 Tax=Corynespora cassiicola Philippines TaxID=1448308 RepID=A0A2T2NJL6_CORCC|nr:hypothetical protein BS50DRAFT_590005 [Corynespora cassiicola Philippines]
MVFPIPPSAMQRLPEIRNSNHELVAALEAHPKFAEQRNARQGKVYFMWDFATKTEPSPDTAAMSEQQKNSFKRDAIGRCILISTLVTDTSGKSSVMFNERPGQVVDLGDRVKSAADALPDVIIGDIGNSM